MSEEQVFKHFRYGGKLTHSGCEVLPNGKPIDVTITSVEYKLKEMVNGKEQETWIANIRELKNPMLLNSTNRKRLARLAGSDYLETLKDFTVTLCAEETKDPSDGGSKIMGLRISKIKAKQAGALVTKIALDVSDGIFAQIASWLSGPDGTLAGVMTKYELTPAAESKLREIKDK